MFSAASCGRKIAMTRSHDKIDFAEPILLKQLDYSLSISMRVIVDSVFGLINYHLIEIESESNLIVN